MSERTLKKFLSRPVNSDDTWQGGIISAAEVFGAAGVDGAFEQDAVIVLWRSTATGFLHSEPIRLNKSDRFQQFFEVMLKLFAEQEFPYRPARLECNDQAFADGLSQMLSGTGTIATFVTQMTEWDAVLQSLAERAGKLRQPLPSLIDAGCTEQQVREFARAAADFHRAELWNYLDDIDLISIESPAPPAFLKFAVVLGSAAQTYGLGLYDDAEDHYRMMAQRVEPGTLSLFNISFDSPEDIRSKDVELWRKLDLTLETSDSFPTIFFHSEQGTRRPTPQELEFATLVLSALAATTEAEIDSGRWSKSVDFRGKPQTCAFSIPNLLNPPDRREWMRRGQVTESRANEHHFTLVQKFIESHIDGMSLDELNAAINTRFIGPIDDIKYPLDTPVDRAVALCQQAFESFGRRRIQLARQALQEDPTHVEAHILLAESARPSERSIPLYRRAQELARAQLGSTMEEAVGHFWGFAETRPFMRASYGLAAALHETGQPQDAIAQYSELLRLNPHDNQGVRYELIPLLILQNRDAEAVELLRQFREESTHWHYLNSLVEYRRSSRSAIAKQAAQAAFRANKHVVPMTLSGRPPLFPNSYAPGSPEEAEVCMTALLAVWEETDGYFAWMSDEFERWAVEQSKELRARRRSKAKKGTTKRGTAKRGKRK